MKRQCLTAVNVLLGSLIASLSISFAGCHKSQQTDVIEKYGIPPYEEDSTDIPVEEEVIEVPETDN